MQLPMMSNYAVAIAIKVTIVILTLALITLLVERRLNVLNAKAEALRQSEEKFRFLVQNASDIIAILATSGVINYVSLSINSILGYEPESLVGKTAFNLVHPEDIRTAELLLKESIENPNINLSTEIRLKHALKGWQYFEVVYNNQLHESSVTGIITTYRNITEHKKSELALQNRMHQQASVAQISHQALAAKDIDSLIDTTIRLIAQTLGVEYCELLEFIPEDKELLLRSGVGWQPSIVGQTRIKASSNSHVGYTLLSPEPVIVENLHTETRFIVDALLLTEEVISGMSVMIRGTNFPYGILRAHTKHQRLFDNDEIYFLRSVANLLATAIERKKTELLLQRYRLLSEHSLDMMLFSRMNGEIIEANNAALKAYRYKAIEFLSLKINDLWPASQKNFIHNEYQQVDSNGLVYETIHRRSDGSTFPVEISSRGIELGDERVILSIVRDITERKRFEQALFRAKEMAQVTLQSIGDAVITTDAFGRIKSLNPVAETLTGWLQTEAEGLPLKEVFRIINEVTQQPIENPVSKMLRGNPDETLANNTILLDRHGREFAITHSVAPIRTREGEIIGVVLVFRDVTESRQIARQLSWQASHDPLTGLPNRREFERKLEQALIGTETQNQQHALCYLDLDKFKIVNDTCGHAAGDELLRQVTGILKAQVRKSDTVARLGGDEFAILLHQCSLEEAKAIAEKILKNIQQFKFLFEEQTFTIGVSIGLVAINEDMVNLSSVLSLADAACYTAKNKGRNRVCISFGNNSNSNLHRTIAE